MKTKKTSCRKCGGNGKPSKGFMNFHNLQRNDAKEFETKLLDCIKCESCGHSWIPETPTREQALVWWNSLPFNSSNSVGKTGYCKKYFGGFTMARTYETLTSKEIEEIWLKETQDVPEIPAHLKLNQKQFKQFDESLFKAYIDKFSDEDKIKAIEIIFKSLPDSVVSNFILENF